ncbi:tyrosine-protein phosphatase non-receptor type 13-like [Corticium candelabrum]|uniref:tyrosine-protein phosphatase non-receptor type 13-like n=1 Tax=Corticium candelabrum TaxID=121492 RepID=UPI002E273E81|nr:tyrosine-protein phosphatase non-receptor type 13-like [Corticium candelabrum]
MDDTPAPQTVDRRQIARDFKAKVNNLIDDERDRAIVFEVLKDYQTTLAVDTLVKSLREILCMPKRLELFKHIRALLPPKHHKLYDDLCPVVPSGDIRTVKLHRVGDKPLGFTIRGGREYNTGVFISSVTPNSKATKANMKVGDCVVRINGYNISELTHNEVVQFLKTKKSLALKLKSEGLLPEKKSSQDPIEWTVVEKEEVPVEKRTRSESVVAELGSRDPTAVNESEKRIVVHNMENTPLGCTIRGGIEHDMGIFVADVNEDSMADAVGLQSGDQILSVNGISFLNISHAEAIKVIRSSSSLIFNVKSANVNTFVKPLEPLEPEISNPNITFKAVSVTDDTEIPPSPTIETKPAAQVPTVFKAAPGLAPASVFVADGLPDTRGMRIVDVSVRDSFYSIGLDDESRQQSRRTSEDNVHSTTVAPWPTATPGAALFPVAVPTEIPVPAPQLQQLENTGEMDGIEQILEPPDFPLEEEPATSENQKEIQIVSPKSSGGQDTETKQSGVFEVKPDIVGNDLNKLARQIGDDVIQGGQLKKVTVKKDGPLGISIQGGMDTRHGGCIHIKSIDSSGAIARQGCLHVGDKVLLVENKSMVAVTHSEAVGILKKAVEMDKDTINMIVAMETADKKN